MRYFLTLLSFFYLTHVSAQQTPVCFFSNVETYLNSNETGIFGTWTTDDLQFHDSASVYFAGDTLYAGSSTLPSLIMSSDLVTPQSIATLLPYPSATIAQLEIDNTHGVQLQVNTLIEDELKILNGLLFTENYSLTLSDECSIPSYSDTNYIVNPAGKIHVLLNEGDSIFIPTGPSSADYMPIGFKTDLEHTDTVVISFEPNSATTIATNSTLKHSWIIEKRTSNEDSLTTYLYNKNNAATDSFNFDDYYVGKLIPSTNTWQKELTNTNHKINNLHKSTFELSSSGTYSKLSVVNSVPVDLLDFYGTVLTLSSALLRWETASERNNSHFIVERALNSQGDFVHIDTVPSQATNGNSDNIISYSLTDSQIPVTDHVLYRLTQYDYNGNSEQYYTIVNFGHIPELLVWPNPVYSQMHIKLPIGARTVSVYDLLGKLVYQKVISSPSNIQISTKTWRKGIYTLLVELDNNQITRRIIK